MTAMDQFRTVFFEECADLLSAAEEHLSRLSEGTYDIEDVHAIFRAVHSVKGGAGTFGFDMLVDFSHVFETTLDLLREHHVPLETEDVDVLLRSNDMLTLLVNHAQNNLLDSAPDSMNTLKEQLSRFREKIHTNAGVKNQASLDQSAQNTSAEKPSAPQRAGSQEGVYIVEFSPYLEIMRFGNEPHLILRELKKLAEPGQFHVVASLDKLPRLCELNLEHCYLSWVITLKTDVSMERVRECFEFVEDDCHLKITPVDTLSQHQDGASSLEGAQVAPQSSSSSSSETSQSDNVSQPKTHANNDATGVPSQMPAKTAQKVPSQNESQVHSIRVELDRIDRLVNTVGEMVIKQAMILDASISLKGYEGQDVHNYSNIIKGLEELTQHTRELQESVMAIRAQPVKAVFSRMPRLVRELASQLKKNITLHMSGENTEIDKTVIERLGEPLTHMIRNAVDHGIENEDVRIQQGKPREGHISLNAEHKSGHIVIQVSDDGRGINREKLLSKARERGIVDEGAVLSGEEVDQLVFHPGFSTAQKVTNVSGRGVGMDVVKKSIQGLGGRITIRSVEGEGCTFSMMLPLTLAVLDGMIVKCGSESYVIPLVHIVETLRPAPNQLHHVVQGVDLLNLRHSNIPLVYLGRIFNIYDALEDATQGIVVVLETENGEHIGLVVDDIVTQQQVVLKSLEANYDPIEGISAATILGNGQVSLILDVNRLGAL